MTSLTALRDWCRETCACYPDLKIENLSSSFRDGLAFCAIIHKHRPELLDFSSLSRDDSYHNNQLAFQTAEEKLGIPALLHPKELVSSEAPDPLGVITYLSWYYCFFSGMSWAGLASLGSSRETDVKRLPRTRAPDGPRRDEEAARRERGRGPTSRRSSSARARAVCRLCLKPVHLIQRRLGGGKVYHRSCFRCGVCHCTLLPRWCTQRGDSGSLVCSHHPADSQMSEPEPSPPPPAGPQGEGPTGPATPPGGSEVGSAPGYAESAQPNGEPAREGADAEGRGGEEVGGGAGGQSSGDPAGSPDPPGPDAAAQQEATRQPPEVLAEGQERASEPRPAPTVPGGAPGGAVGGAPPGTSCSQTTSRDRAAELSPSECTCPARLKPSTSVRLNHPWLNIIHPGPWTQLPAAPPPAPSVRSWYRPRVAAPNPFEEAPPQKAERSGGGACSPGSEGTCGKTGVREGGNGGGSLRGAADARAPRVTPLPRSLSVPPPEGPKSASRWAQHDQQPALSRSQTLQAPPSPRAPAPGHGYPLVRRKVQTDPGLHPRGLRAESADLDKRLEAMEQRGVELEKKLRDCRDEGEEEEMLSEWITLNHDRHALVRKDMELAYLTMQQKLEERQADVEYELRRLFVKQEDEWTEDERGEERRLMDELVSLIEQRNQIICSLDQDVQREREEDKLLDATLNRQALQKPKGKSKPGKVFKLLQHRAATGAKQPPGERS